MQVYALEDRTEVEEFVSTPNQKISTYQKPSSLYDSLKTELDDLRDKVIDLLSYFLFLD
jgi:hypothetical protein